MNTLNIEPFVANTANEITEFMKKLEINDTTLGIDVSKGKKLRGTLTVLISKCINGNQTKAFEFASAVELIHLGSLTHDDIIDEHETRRGTIPLNLLKGTKFAVLTGDRMFALATRLGSKSGNKEASEVAEAMESVLSGAIKEISIREFITDVSSGAAEGKFYYKMIGLKTASLFKSAGKFGAMTCTDKASIIDDFGAIGQNIGTVYQIADDLVDIIKMGEGKKEPDIGSIVSIIPAVFHYNKESAKTIPFAIISGRLSVDKILDLMSSMDMSGKMLEDINKLIKETESMIDNLVNQNEYTDILREYMPYCVNQMLSEVGEKV